MKSEQKNKRRGRSPSPKRKLKRKYRNDRSKKAHQSSSESSSSEDASLTSDEYPSSGEERRKEAKKKRLKKVKHKAHASGSSSTSPSPEKVKKKSKLKDDGDGKKEKYRKDRKFSPSPKKKRRKSSESGGSSDESLERSPVKKEKAKKRHSPSPVKVKKKRSVSPVAGKGSGRLEKKKKSVSPIRSRKKSSPSPPSKNRRSRSLSPVKNKKNRSPPRQKKSLSPSPPRSKKRNDSPLGSKYNQKSRSPASRSRKRSTSPPLLKEKRVTPDSRVESRSPVPNRSKQRNRSPAPLFKSSTTSISKGKGSLPRAERKSPLLNNVEKKLKIHGPVLPALPPDLKSPSPLSPTDKPPSLNKVKNGAAEATKRSVSPIGEVTKKSVSAMENVRKRSVSPTQEVKKKTVAPMSGKEIHKKSVASMSARDIAKKVIAAKSVKELEKKVIAAAKPTKEVGRKIVSPEEIQEKGISPISTKEVEKKVPTFTKEVERKVSDPRLSRGVERKVATSVFSNEGEKKDETPMPAKVIAPSPVKEIEQKVIAPMPTTEIEQKVIPPISPKEAEKQQNVSPVTVSVDIKSTKSTDVKSVASIFTPISSESSTRSDASVPRISNIINPTEIKHEPKEAKRETLEVKQETKDAKQVTKEEKQETKEAKQEASLVPAYIPVSTLSGIKNTIDTSADKNPIPTPSPLVEIKKEDPLPAVSTPTVSASTTTSNITRSGGQLATLSQASNIKIKSPLVIRKKITIVSALNVMAGKKPVVTPPVKDEGSEDSKTSVISPTQVKTSSSVFSTRSRKRSSSPVRNRKKSKSISPTRNRKRSKSPSPRSRKRSKSPRRDRKRSRSRSPGRYRRDDKQRRRSRSGSPSRIKRDRDRSPDKDSKKRKQGEVKRKDDERSSEKKDRDDKDRRRNRDDKDRRKKDEKDSRSGKRDKSPEKKDITELEEEMKKRKERIEAWRNANRKKGDAGEGDTGGSDATKAEKKWSLEDDDSEDEELGDEGSHKKSTGKSSSSKKDVKKEKVKEEAKDDADDDPLDSFMKSIDAEVNTLSGRNTAIPVTTAGTKTKTITVLKTVTVNKPEEVKPEVMEQNQDALEYSSEEEETADIKASDFTDATKKRKELTVADHSKIYYAPFRRDFYVEVPELARMSADEVKLLRETLGDIQVRGKNIPKPIKTWAQAGLSSKVMSVLKRCEYEKPTPVQAQALPVAMSGRDMIGIAKTGSGKTLAFVLPMLRHVLDQPALDEDDGPIAIIMTPTRELALQIYRESKKFCKILNLNVTCIYGGSGISEQISELKKGTEIIVCTPGRMIDMLAANNGRVTNCRRCTYLVMDEADRMFDMGFEPQVMRIIGNIRPDRQTVLFSATFPRQMEAVARKVLTKPIEIQVGGRSIVCSDVEQHAIVIEEDNKFFKVLELLGVYQENGSILLFVERQETADRLFKDLLKQGYPCLSLHGGMDQFDRDSTIADFKNSVTRLMVSTSVAARGLDVKNLNLVVNYDCPNHYEDYVHRVGRTGRAGNKGTAFTFITPEQGRSAGDVLKAFELSKCEPPDDVVAVWTLFKEDMEKEGKTIKMNSGFSGTKGFKFNAEEDAMVNESKKMRKFTLGLQDSDEEAEAADDAMEKIEADLEKAFSSKPKIALQPEVAEGQKVKIAEQNVDKDKLKQASSIAALINKKLSSGQVIDRNTAATAHIMQGGALESLTGVGLAKQLADKVNAKLNYKAAEVESQVEEKPIAVRYEEEIDINDFPQQARWRITSKEIIEQVRELSEAGVTVRGLYIPPNKKPEEEERRLHLYIESLSERSIQIAKAEIKRLLKDELLKSESNSYRPTQQTGRYKVL